MLEAAGQLMLLITQVFTALDALATDFKRAAAGALDPAALAKFAGDMVERITENLLVRYLESFHQVGWQLLSFFTIIEYDVVEVSVGAEIQHVLRRRLYFEKIGLLFSNPLALFNEAYGWGTDSFDGKRLFAQTAGLANVLGLLADNVTADDGTAAFDLFAVTFAPTPKTNALPPGIEGTLYVDLAESSDITIAQLSETSHIALRLSGTFGAGLVFRLLPPTKIEVDGGATVAGDVSLSLVSKASDATHPLVLFGGANGTRLEAKSVQASLIVALRWIAQANKSTGDVGFEARFQEGKLSINTSEADGFLQRILPADGVTAGFDFGLGWTAERGFYFSGGSGLEVRLPIHIELGPVALEALTVVAKLEPRKFPISFGADIRAALGPIVAVVENMGVTATLSFPSDNSGNLGPFQFDLGFKPPDGVGLVVDAAGVTGGGFLRHDDAKHEYSGVLQLQFIDLALQAFGLITTQVAGGAGYSLLALVDAEFPPVQLGWGFTLNGVGGLLAVHRTASTDALHAALKAGQLSTILFPKNAITNAPAILAQLDALFPTAPGRFLFGPMALIGWGTPTVLTASVAVVVELPEPVRVILLARIEARLPDPSAPLVRINMDALGILDLGKGELSFDAVLFDSRLVIYTLSGAMALRASWATQREFVLAIGGFHPRFAPPAGFPTLQRMTIDMPSGIVTKLRLSAYLALTSNSIQIGANLDAFIGVSGFGLSGHLGFDALLQRHPFHFEADISGSVALTAGGDDLASVSLDATLTGPAPYNIAGKFKVHVVFFDVHVSFNHSWGEDAPSLPVPSVDVGALLGAALAELDSWDALLPDGVSPLVSVRRIEDAGSILAHPLARPQVHERIVPLELAITRYGEAAPTGGTQFAITDLHLGADPHVGSTAIPHEAIQDDFAPAQFFELTDEEKLARPSFERHDAGVRVAGGLVASGAPTSKTTAYETFYVDEPGGVQRADPGVVVTPPGLGDLRVALQFGSAGRAAIKSTGRRYQTAGTPLRVAEPAFVVADTSTMALSGVGPAAGATFSDLHALLGSRRGLQIVATHELAA
ncbi:MAG TPA: DUF6603 domain-containing protein [Steroidobacteraceae bacterium]|nr:DUF6603 domain-containing protein [Steroidobacteraceae bacterium]